MGHSVKSAIKSVTNALEGFRHLFSSENAQDLKRQTFPMPNDSWAPDIRCGEFVIVETAGAIRQGMMACICHKSTGSFSIVKITPWNSRMGTILDAQGEEDLRPHWNLDYGVQSHGARTVRMCDGPFDEPFLREMLVGEVAGILGAEDRALSWHKQPS
jgi:hypothetical protein